MHSISNTPPPCRNGLLLSPPDKQICEFNDGGRKDPEPGFSASEDKEDQWDDKEAEAEADNKEEEEEEQHPTTIATRTGRLYCVPRRSDPCLPLGRSLARNVISHVAAFRHHLVQTREPRRGMSRIAAPIHLPNPTRSQSLDPLLPAWPALRETQAMMVQ